VIGVQLKRHNFGQCESFRELVDISRMCLSWVSFGGGRAVWGYKRTKKKQISAIAAVDVLLSHDAKVDKPLCDFASVNK